MQHYSKVIFMYTSNLCKRVDDIFCIQKWIDNGYEVEYWDLSDITFKEHLHPIEITGLKEINIRSLNEYKCQLKKIDIHHTIFFMWFGCYVYTWRIFYYLSVYGCNFAFFANGRIPSISEISKQETLLQHARRIATSLFSLTLLEKIKAIILSEFVKTMMRTRWIKPADFFFSVGDLTDIDIKVGPHTVFAGFNSGDYETSRKVHMVKDDYIVFVDQYLPYHRDFEILGINHIDANCYYSSLNVFFDFIEKKYNMPVIIAAHPSALNYNKYNPFNNRKIEYNKTEELIVSCRGVLAHRSTALSFAVLFEKPIIFVSTKGTSRIPCFDDNIILVSRLLGMPYVNIDITRECFFSEVDKEKYDNYKYQFLTNKETEDFDNFTIISSVINSNYFMKIDLSNLTEDQALLFNNNKREVIVEYQKMTDTLLNRCSELSWLLNNVTSRNTGFSNILKYMRYEKLLDDISKTSNIDEVITNDACLAQLLKQKYKVLCISKRKRKLNVLFDVVHCLVWSFCALMCKSKERVRILKQCTGATIIDTDMAKKSDKYNDRYYGNSLDALPKTITKDFFYNIIYLPFPKNKDIALIDRNTSYNIIYVWDFLKFCDYIYAFRQMFVRNRKTLLDYVYLGINQRPVLESAYKDNVAFYYYMAFLYERMIYRMNQKKINIKLYVDWFENQSVDKSFHWAMKKYYPSVKVHSYIGFMADTMDNPMTIATNTELAKNIAPMHIFVCNKALKDQYSESGYNGRVSVAPFFRAEQIWNIANSRFNEDSFNLLVPLGLDKGEVAYKTKCLVSFLKSNVASNVKVILKPHPVYDETSILQMISGIDGISVVGGNIYDYLTIADAVVASNSTTTYEALALGKPLINMIDPEYKYSLNKPPKSPDYMWLTVTDNDTLEKAIAMICKQDSMILEEVGRRLMDYYFTKQTPQLTSQLFDIHS